jgi:uncharacterized membrane protein
VVALWVEVGYLCSARYGASDGRRMKIQKILIITFLLVALLIALVAVFYVKAFTTQVSGSQEVWGQFGDYFGGVLNPILSFFAFSALLYTVFLQVKSAAESDKKHEEQVFDARLFQLFSANVEVGKSLYIEDTINYKLTIFEGVRAINYTWHMFYSKLRGDMPVDGLPPDLYGFVHVRYSASKNKFGTYVFTYFSSIVFILDFIRSCSKTNDQTIFALNALRSQLSVGARSMLFYYLLCSEQYCKYIPLLLANSFWDDAVEDPLHHKRSEVFKSAAAHHQS